MLWREKQHKFSSSSLSEFEATMLSSSTISPLVTNYEFYKTTNQGNIHDLGCKLLGLFNWEKAKEEFVKLEKNRLVLEIQKACCKNNCFFDPLKCMNDEHDGNLATLLKKETHENIEGFVDYFDKDSVDETLHPPLYDELGNAKVDLHKLETDHVKRCRPSSEFELSKLFNIINAIMESSKVSLASQRKFMFDVFQQKGNGLNLPRLAAMGFGPDCGQAPKYRDGFGAARILQPRKRYAPLYFWMYKHGEDLPCHRDSEKISAPFLDSDGKVCYPCNTGMCHKKCSCESCSNVALLKEEGRKHDEHLAEYNPSCVLAKVQCTDHYVDHPDNFIPEEDIEIEVFNYLNMNLNKAEKDKALSKRVNFPPRINGNLQEKLKLSGLKKICKVCKKNTNDHIQSHHFLHVQCKICDVRRKTNQDENFWKKTCTVCKVYFPNIKRSEMKRHVRGHDRDFLCEFCGIGFARKKYLEQHIDDIHCRKETKFVRTTCQKQFKQERNLNVHHKLRHTEGVKHFKCRLCPKVFLYRFNLNRHLRSNHSADSSALTNVFLKKLGFSCKFCPSVFENKWLLKRHSDSVHDSGVLFPCDRCDKTFAREDNRRRHMISTHEALEFICPTCKRVFSRKDNMLRHLLKHSN